MVGTWLPSPPDVSMTNIWPAGSEKCEAGAALTSLACEPARKSLCVAAGTSRDPRVHRTHTHAFFTAPWSWTLPIVLVQHQTLHADKDFQSPCVCLAYLAKSDSYAGRGHRRVETEQQIQAGGRNVNASKPFPRRLHAALQFCFKR